MNPSSPPPLAPAPGVAKPRKLGCWFYGCTSLFIIVILGCVIAYFGARSFVRQVRANYTSEQPAPIEHVVLPQPEWETLQKRLQGFSQALDKGEPQELILTEQELNAYLNQEPRFKKIADRVHLDLEGDQVGGQISYPLPDEGVFKMLGLGGRYLNGNATFDVNLSDGRLHVYLQTLEVNGKKVPEAQLREFRKTDLMKDVQDQNAEKNFRKFESIEVRDSKVILKSKPQAASQPAVEAGAAPPSPPSPGSPPPPPQPPAQP